MKRFVFLVGLICVAGLFVACENDKKFLYGNSNCNDVKRDCLNICRKEGKAQALCLTECEKVRGMCAAVKIKGCLQDCTMRFGKNSPQTDQCKGRCQASTM